MKNDDPAAILARIQKRIDDLGLSRAKACRLANIGPDIIRDLERRGTIPKLPTMTKLAAVLGVDAKQLYGSEEQPSQAPVFAVIAKPTDTQRDTVARIPIVGIAYGSLQEASGISDAPIGWVEPPPSLRSTPGAYAVYVDGDSMAPQHNPGELRFIDPNRPCRPGDTVIIRTRTNTSEPIRLAIKRLVSRSGDEVIADQINPKRSPATVKFSRAAILSVDRVLTVNEMFGV